jgi:PAS domain S-box-containing protein
VSVLENGIFVDCNDATLKMLQIKSKDKIVGRTPWDISPEFQADGKPSEAKAKEMIDTCLEKGSNRFEWVHKRDNGTLFYGDIILTAAPDTDAVLVIWRDITEEVANRQKIKESEEKYRITLNSIGDAVITTDIDGNVQMMNPLAEKLTGWKRKDATGRPLEDVFAIVNAFSGETVESPVRKVLKTGNVVGLANHTVLVSKDGKEHQIADSGAPIKDDSGDILGVVLVFRDVTETYRLHEQLKQSEKMDAMGRMASGLAHDFNNMISGIVGAADLLTATMDPENEYLIYAEKIKEVAVKASELTKQLLNFARKSDGMKRTVEVHSLVDETVKMVSSSLGNKLKIDIDLNGKAEILADKSQIQNALINLIFNARDAMPEGGTISFRSKIIDVPDNVYNPLMLAPGSYLKLSIKDTGHGVDDNIKERIFEPFFTTKEGEKGTGLGLASVYRAVKNHDGEVELVSNVGKGSDFLIYLPLIDQ